MSFVGVGTPSLTVQPRQSGSGTTILDSFKFSGSMTGVPAVLKARFLGDVPNSAFIAAVQYPATGPSGNATLRVKPSANTITVATNFRVFVNGVASGLVVVIPAGTRKSVV